MPQQLTTILAALAPLFALIALGYALREMRFVAEPFWPQMERLVYYLLFPALLVESLGSATLSGERFASVALAVLLTLVAMALLAYQLRRAIRVDGPTFSSLFQGSLRFNTYLGIAIAIALEGRAGAALAAIVAAVLIPLINVICVVVLVRHARGAVSMAAVASGIARNPLILACVLGIALSATGVGLPAGSGKLLGILGQAALPLGLLAVGAGLQFGDARGYGLAITATATLKLAVMPAIAWAACTLVALTPLESRIVILFAALPTATSAYILARQMGGDHRLMAAVLTIETLLSALSLPLVLVLGA